MRYCGSTCVFSFRKSTTVSVDRSEITSIKSKYEDEIELWKKKVNNGIVSGDFWRNVFYHRILPFVQKVLKYIWFKNYGIWLGEKCHCFITYLFFTFFVLDRYVRIKTINILFSLKGRRPSTIRQESNWATSEKGKFRAILRFSNHSAESLNQVTCKKTCSIN